MYDKSVRQKYVDDRTIHGTNLIQYIRTFLYQYAVKTMFIIQDRVA